MSLNQIVKYPSEQASFDTTGNKNNVDFILQGGQVYDLSKSYITVSVSAQSSTSTANDFFVARGMLNLGSSVDGVAMTEPSVVHLPSSASFVRNAHMSSQNKDYRRST